MNQGKKKKSHFAGEQIRFIRPNPQQIISDIFLRGKGADRSMMVVFDPYFEGHLPYIKPGSKTPILFKDGVHAIELGRKIIEDTIKSLKIYNWKIWTLHDCGLKHEIKMIKRITNSNVEITNYKSMVNDTRCLIAFISEKSRCETVHDIIKKYLKKQKQVCCVDPYGVKRYPRYQRGA